MEVPATNMVINTPTLPPTIPIVAPPTQNTVSPVRFHTPNASPPNPPNKDDNNDEDNSDPSDSDSESGEDTNEKNAPAAGGGNANHANSGNPGGDPDDSDNDPHDDESQGSDSDNESESNVEVVDEVFSPSIQNQLASHLVRLSDKIDSINDDSSSRSIMQVKSIEMTLTKLDKASIEDFKFKAQIACRDLKNLNPAIWIAKPILNTLLKQANKDITESMKSSSGQPRYFKYSRLTAEDLYVKIGERSPKGDLIGVSYIVKIMTPNICLKTVYWNSKALIAEEYP